MNPKQTLRKRDIYLNKLIAFKDTEPVKIITGIRRCGKSSLLKLMVEHLKENKISTSNIIEIFKGLYVFATEELGKVGEATKN